MADYKEGVDFEWVLMKNQPKGGTNKTRRFFTKAEKVAKGTPKAEAKVATKVAARVAPKTKPTKAPVKDAMQGYRVGDVKTSRLPEDLGKDTRKVLADTKSKAFKPPKHPISSPHVAGPFNKANILALQSFTRKEYDAMTPAERAAKNLPKSLGKYAMGPRYFKTPSAEGSAYAKGGMTKKKKAC